MSEWSVQSATTRGGCLGARAPLDAQRRCRKVIQLHRLREVLALAGFTRFETVTSDVNGEYESDVERADLALEPKWSPRSKTAARACSSTFVSLPEPIDARGHKRPGEPLLNGAGMLGRSNRKLGSEKSPQFSTHQQHAE